MLANLFDRARTQYNSTNGRDFSRKFGGNTTVNYYSKDGIICVTLYNTPVFAYSFRTAQYIVNCGGYNTVTTRGRINQCFGALGIRGGVSSRKFVFMINGEELGSWARCDSMGNVIKCANTCNVYKPIPAEFLALAA